MLRVLSEMSNQTGSEEDMKSTPFEIALQSQNESRKRKMDDSQDHTNRKAARVSDATHLTAVDDGGNTNDSEETKTEDKTAMDTTAKSVTTTSSENIPTAQSEISPPNTDSNDVYQNLKYIIVRNDGKPESVIKLVGLKSLFAKQLPKMPRAYIARLVFDRRHASLAILSDDPSLRDSDEEIIGGICYRAFEDMR